jgi:hypothetical protein
MASLIPIGCSSVPHQICSIAFIGVAKSLGIEIFENNFVNKLTKLLIGVKELVSVVYLPSFFPVIVI